MTINTYQNWANEGIVSQVSAVNQKVAAACGVSPVVMRPPGGYIDAHSLSVLGSMGMPAIMCPLIQETGSTEMPKRPLTMFKSGKRWGYCPDA